MLIQSAENLRVSVQEVRQAMSESRELNDALLLEYDVAFRTVTPAVDTQTELATDISVSSNTRRFRTTWCRNGNNQYWEILGEQVDPMHLVAWTDGERWYVYEPLKQTGGIQAEPPELFYLAPSNMFESYHGRILSSLLSDAEGASLTRDTRYHNPVYRIFTKEEGFPPTRLMLELDESIQWKPRRIYLLRDDFIQQDYELKEIQRSSNSTLIPARYRMLVYQYQAISHYMYVHCYYEYECRLSRAVTDLRVADAAVERSFPPGTVVFNKLTGERSLVGNTLSAGFSAWLNEHAADHDKAADANWWWSRELETPQSETRSQSLEMGHGKALRETQCGPIALAGLASVVLPTPVELEECERACHSEERGCNVQDILEAGRGMGLKLVAVDWHAGELPRDAVPFIALVRRGKEGSHFVFVEPRNGNNALRWRMTDFPRAARDYEVGEVLPGWDGVAIIPAADLDRMNASPRVWAQQSVTVLLAGCALLALGTILVMRRRGIVGPRPHTLMLLTGVISIAITACGQPSEGGAQQRAERERLLNADPTVLEFGLVPYQESRSIPVRIHNSCPDPFTIDDVSSICSCTAVTLPGSIIKSGAFMDVPVQFRGIKRGSTSTVFVIRGHFSNRNDPANLEIGLTAQVPGHLLVDPPRLLCKSNEPRKLVLRQFMTPFEGRMCVTAVNVSESMITLHDEGEVDSVDANGDPVLSHTWSVVVESPPKREEAWIDISVSVGTEHQFVRVPLKCK
jgi:hypothetical protein